MRIWITRAQPGADQTAARLRALGHDPLVAPLLCVRRLAIDPPDLTEVSAIAFTSANAVRSFAALFPAGATEGAGMRRLPVFAVGDATAAEACEHGFASVASADGDVAALAQAILNRRQEIEGVVLHPCALEAAGDLVGALAANGVGVRPHPLYDTVGVDQTPEAAAHALQAKMLDVIMIHSPKAARVLKSLLALGAPAASEHIELAVLSAACAAPLADFRFAAVTIAPVPRDDALLTAFAT